MDKKQITYKLADTGHWLARCDHESKVIELNRRDFFELSPMMQDYIWIHEYVHLKYGIYDEAECNSVTDRIFISRAENEKDKISRIKFVASSHDSVKSNFWSVVVSNLISLGTTVASSVWGGRNSGYYSLSDHEQFTYVDNLLSEAFKASLLTDKQSAKDIFWSYISPNIGRAKEKTSFNAWLGNNMFARTLIAQYETQWGFGFDELTPIDEKRHPSYQKTMGIVSILAVVIALIILVIVLKKTKK